MLLFNNKTPKKINFNGKNVAKVIYNGIVVWLEKVLKSITGYPITLTDSVGEDLVDYKVYGDSVQDGIPIPDAPIEVESVGELLNYINIDTLENGTIRSDDGKNHEQENRVRTGFIYLKAGTYCLSTVGTKDDVRFGSYVHRYSNVNVTSWIKTIACTDIFTGTRNYKVFTLDNACYCRFVLLPTNTSSITNLSIENISNYKPQLELGNVPSDYEPYGYKIPITVKGKNIWNTALVTEYNSITYEGKLEVSSWWTSTYPSAAIYSIPVKPNTTYSFYSSFINNYSVAEYSIEDKTLYKVHYINDANRNYTFTTSANTYYLKILGNSNLELQLEEGDKVTGYERYIEPITTNIYLKEPLRRLGNYADYIDFEKKQVVRNITEYIVPSDINWDTELGDSYNLIRFKITNNQIVGQKVPFTEQKCNYTVCDEQTTKNTAQGVSIYYSSSLGGTFFRARDTVNFSKPSEYRAFIKSCSVNGKPFKVYFDSYGQTYETITLPNIPTHKGTTIIEVDTEVLPSNMEVEYYGKE